MVVDMSVRNVCPVSNLSTSFSFFPMTLIHSTDDEDLLLTRPESAKLLGVSTRTIDRYIADGKLSVVRKNGKVLLERSDIELIKNQKNPVVAQIIKDLAPQANPEKEFETEKYRILYEQSKEDIDKRDELLRQMHYRLGSLETQNQNSVPVLEAENKERELITDLESSKQENVFLKDELSSAKKARMVFFILALISFISLFLFFIFSR